jgi:hypothetical protein
MKRQKCEKKDGGMELHLVVISLVAEELLGYEHPATT